jgi:hypothetical protein
MLAEWRDTTAGKVAGAISAFGAAVFVYRSCFWFFKWIFAVYVWEVFSWLLWVALAIGLIWVSTKLWSRWRLVFGTSLLLFILWAITYWLPRVKLGVAAFGDDRYGFVNTTALYANTIVLLVVAVVALCADWILAWWRANRKS